MKRYFLAFLVAIASVSVAAPSAQKMSQSADTYTVECTFTNPAYSGQCTVSEDMPRSLSVRASCNRILGCLNNNQCITKTYCNATSIRSGWKLVTAKAAPRPKP